MRTLVRRLHLIVALGAGLFLAVFAVTGSIMAFEPELDHLLHARVSFVTPGASPRPLADLGAAAARVVPDGRVSGYLLSVSPDLSYQVLFRGRAVFVNQYTGEVLGIREAGPDFLSRVHQLHLRLLIQNRADTGKTIMTGAGAAFLFLLLSGVYLWWPLKRIIVRTRGGGRRVWFDLHNAIGIFSLVFLLLIAVTGIAIGFDDGVVPMIYKATQSAPVAMYARPPTFKLTPTGPPIGPDRAIEIARGALRGAAPISVNIPAPTAPYAVSARYPEDRTPGGRSRVYIDQYTGAVLVQEGSRTAPLGSRIITMNRAIHTGDVFGIPSKAVMSLASLAVFAQLLTGVVMWLRR